jgi:putative inorganic carbon (HCO3(-)) transporter
VVVGSQAVAAVVAVAGLCGLILAGGAGVRRLAALAWAGGTLWLAADLLRSSLDRARTLVADHPAAGAVAVAVAATALVAAAAAARRWPWAFVLACVAAAPARVSVHFGGQDAHLLVPLYCVLAAGVLATLYDALRGTDPPPRMGAVGRALAAFVALSGASVIWTVDPHHAAVGMLFFYLPFGFMAVRVAQLGPNPAGLRAAFVVQLALAIVFAVVGLAQEATHRLVWHNPGVDVSNTYHSFFRVNSLFWDTSIYGRYLAVTIVLLAAVAVFRGLTVPLAAVIVLLVAGLYFAYSQSAWFALAAGAVALGTFVWPRRVVIGLAAAAVLAVAGLLAIELAGASARRVSSGRSRLVELGWRVVRHHPIIGSGFGGFAKSAVAGTAHPYRIRGAESHTTPVTVLAELGPLGFVLYAWLLRALVRLATSVRTASPVTRGIAAALVSIFASSLFYNAFFEDPAMWLLVGLVCGWTR